jgi:hypothetical protein
LLSARGSEETQNSSRLSVSTSFIIALYDSRVVCTNKKKNISR